MATKEELVLEVNAIDNASKNLDKITKSTEKLEKEMEELDKTQKDLDKSSKGVGKSSASMGKALGVAGLALSAAAAGAVVLYNELRDLQKIYLELETVNKRLAAGLESSGQSSAEAAANVRMFNKQFLEMAGHGGTVNELSAAFSDANFVLKDTTEAMGHLTIAQNVAAKSGKSLEESSKALLQARQGDTGAIKEMNILSHAAIAVLDGMVAGQKKNEAILQEVTRATKGYTASMSESIVQMNKMDAQLLEVQTGMGNLVDQGFKSVQVAAGKLIGGPSSLGSLADAFNSTARGVELFNEELANGSITMVEFAGDAAKVLALFQAGGIAGIGSFLGMAAAEAEASGEAKILEENLLAVEKQVDAVVEKMKADILRKEFGTTGPTQESPEARAERARKDATRKQRIADHKARLAELKAEAEARKRALSLDDAKALADVARQIANAERDAAKYASEKAAALSSAQGEADAITALQNEIELTKELTDAERARLELKQKFASIATKLARKEISAEQAKLEQTLAIKSVEKQASQEKIAAQAMALDATRAGVEGALGLAETLGAGEREMAGIRGAIEVAESIAAFASFNIAGGIGHAAAAASFFAVAGGAGGSGGGSAGGSPPAASGAGSTGTQGATEGIKEAFVEALNESDQGGRNITYVINNSGQFLESSKNTARRISDQINGVSKLQFKR